MHTLKSQLKNIYLHGRFADVSIDVFFCDKPMFNPQRNVCQIYGAVWHGETFTQIVDIFTGRELTPFE